MKQTDGDLNRVKGHNKDVLWNSQTEQIAQEIGEKKVMKNWEQTITSIDDFTKWTSMQVGRCLIIFHNLIFKKSWKSHFFICWKCWGWWTRNQSWSTGARQCVCISLLPWGLCVSAVTFVCFLFWASPEGRKKNKAKIPTLILFASFPN